MTEVHIGLGSNLGDRIEMLRQALERLDALMAIAAMSPVYETPPRYVEDQPPFLNMAVAGDTPLDPRQLLEQLKRIELDLGRVPAEARYGPRAIDLDILFFGQAVIDRPGLAIPHPLMAEREFVLRPLADIAAGKRHPVTGKSVGEMLAALGGTPSAVPFPIEV